MSQQSEVALIQAIRAYDYPAVTYDFVEQRERRFPSTRELECYLQALLRAPDAQSVKDGLSGVLYWGQADEESPMLRLPRVAFEEITPSWAPRGE